MKKKSVKKIFIFFLIYLPLQYGAVGLIGVLYSEPWPAFVLPAFQNVDATPQYISVKEAQFFVSRHGDQPLQLAPPKIFSGLEQSQLRGFLRTHFSEPGQWADPEKETVVWLQKQIAKGYPSVNDLRNLEVRWIETYYSVARGKAERDSIAVIKKFVIKLGDE